jgi:glycerophosphoryl diester phosphodiesterase
MSKTYSAGIVTAYGAAKRAGYQGTYEDFCRQQAGYAESAAAVEQAKNTAVSAASTATAKATEATTAATAAQTAKEQTEAAASQALTDIGTARSGAISAVQTEGQTQTSNARAQALAAAQSATTASTKASEASASATSAGQSATNAAASATSAANAASAAQGVLDSIPEDYSDLSRDVDDLKADLGDSVFNGALHFNASDFVVGSLDGSGNPQPSNKKRISTANILPINYDSEILIEEDYRIYVFEYNGTTLQTTSGGWITGKYKIKSGSGIKFVIALITEPTTFEADLATFVSKVSYATLIGESYKYSNTVTKIDYTLSDGYFTDYRNGVVVPDTSAAKCQHTEKFDKIKGMKVLYSEIHTSSHALWIAVGEWLTNGSYRRTTLGSITANSFYVEYTPSDDVYQFAFCFRTYDDASLELDLLVSAIELYESGKKHADIIAEYDFDSIRIKGINHRGYHSVAPENTIPAYKLSVEHGFKFVETDVRFTSDNVPVLLHDATVDRTSNGTGNISSMTYAQAKELDFGSWKSSVYAGTKIPSFEEFIVFCRNTNLFPYVEISGGDFSATQIGIIVNIVKKYNMQRSVTWISASNLNLQKIVSLDSEARVGYITFSEPTSDTAATANEFKTGKNEVFLNLDISYLQSALTVSKDANLPLELWTVNNQTTMEELDDYVSGVTSDNLDFADVKKQLALS